MFGMPKAWWWGIITGLFIGFNTALSFVCAWLGFSLLIPIFVLFLYTPLIILIDAGGLRKRVGP